MAGPPAAAAGVLSGGVAPPALLRSTGSRRGDNSGGGGGAAHLGSDGSEGSDGEGRWKAAGTGVAAGAGDDAAATPDAPRRRNPSLRLDIPVAPDGDGAGGPGAAPGAKGPAGGGGGAGGEASGLGVGSQGWEAHASVMAVDEPPDALWLEQERLKMQKAQLAVRREQGGSPFRTAPRRSRAVGQGAAAPARSVPSVCVPRLAVCVHLASTERATARTVWCPPQAVTGALDGVHAVLLDLPQPELNSAIVTLAERPHLLGCCNVFCANVVAGRLEREVAFKRCEQCQRVWYCCEACRAQHAPHHRLFCHWSAALVDIL